MTRLTVEMCIASDEAARQLTGGKHVKVHGDHGTFVIVPTINNQNVDEWRYHIYRDAPVLSERDWVISMRSPHIAIAEAISYADEGVTQ